MKSRRLFWQIYVPSLVIILVSLVGVWWYTDRSVRSFYYDETLRHLLAKAVIMEGRVITPDGGLDTASAESTCQDVGRRIATRITVILPSGKVIADSEENPAVMENHGDRPEVKEALEGCTSHRVRYSDTRRHQMMYVAYPVLRGREVIAVIRTSVSMEALERTLRTVSVRFGAAFLVIALCAALLGMVAARRATKPLEMIRQGAERFARGDLDFRLRTSGSTEMRSLAESMNHMAGQLQERLRAISQQKNERDAVFSSMAEAVIAVDLNERVVHANRAAAQLIGAPSDSLTGKSILEAIRNADLHAFTEQALHTDGSVEGDIVVDAGGERFLQAHGTILHDAEGRRMGALIVLNDVTRLRRLENIRTDFVANVSHELKTPVTSIKGFVETLQEGAADDAGERKRFLEIMARQVDRLEAILNDLLSLSRLEHDAERNEIELSMGHVADVLRRAMEVCEVRARDKNISLTLHCDPSIAAAMNAPLLEQAVVNLIDNAVKYSDDGRQVEVSAERTQQEVRIVVRDSGCGIEARHLSRIFERFYRVDKGRSRQLGGTGLGLAIVKHIVLAHHGRVDAESVVGKESVFTVRLPTAS